MPRGIYDRSDQSNWKPNSGRFQKGEHRNSDTEFKKGQRVSPPTEFKVGIGYSPNGHGKYDLSEYLVKQSQSHKGQHNSTETEFKIGSHYSPYTEFSRGKTSGENHPRWKGGITPINTRERGRFEYAVWRISVFERDDYTCGKCGNRGAMLNAHHVKPFSQYPELRFDTDNGITLCRECHKKVHGKEKEVINGEGAIN